MREPIFCDNCHMILRWTDGSIIDEHIEACQCGAPVEEHPPCLVCGEPGKRSVPCPCLAPTRIITLTFEIHATTPENLPAPDTLLQGIYDGLPDEWYSDAGDGFWIASIGYPDDEERFEDSNVPDMSYPGPSGVVPVQAEFPEVEVTQAQLDELARKYADQGRSI